MVCVIGSNWQLMHSLEEIPQPTYCELLLESRCCLSMPLASKFSSAVANPMKAMFTQYTRMPVVLPTKTVGWDGSGEVPGMSSAVCVINVSRPGGGWGEEVRTAYPTVNRDVHRVVAPLILVIMYSFWAGLSNVVTSRETIYSTRDVLTKWHSRL